MGGGASGLRCTGLPRQDGLMMGTFLVLVDLASTQIVAAADIFADMNFYYAPSLLIGCLVLFYPSFRHTQPSKRCYARLLVQETAT